MATNQMIASLVAIFGKVDRMDPSGPIYAGIIDLLDRADNEALKAVYKARIRFVSALALNRMVRRGIAPAVAA